jgi:signal transduction histidine kinase
MTARLFGSALEVALSCGLLLWAATEAIAVTDDWPMGVRLAFAIAAVAPLAVRHRFPFTVAAIAVIAFAIDLLAEILPTEAVTPLQAVAVATFAVAAYARPRNPARVATVALVVGVPALAVAADRHVPVTAGDVVALVVMQVLASAAAWIVRRRHEEAEHAHDRVVEVGAASTRRLRDDLAAERRRIARELHAIVVRDLAAVARLADAAKTLIGVADAQAIATIATISRTTTSAVEEMRRLLHVLRSDDVPGERRDAVVAADAVAAARERGWSVRLTDQGARDERTRATELAMARIVEELLDGAAGSAGAIAATLTRGERVVQLTLGGRGPSPGPLHDPAARARLRERARLHGGTLRQRRRLAGWRIDVALPARGATAPARPLPSTAADATMAALALLAVVAEQWIQKLSAAGIATALALVVAPVLVRSRAGCAVACTLGVGLLGRALVGWAAPPGGLTLVPVLVLAPYAAAAYAGDTRRAIVGGAVASGATLATLAVWLPETAVTDFPLAACVAAVSWTAGWYVRGSADRALRLRLDETRLAETEPERLRTALEQERHRVARDLHDVVAHGVSLIGVLAGAARVTVVRDPDRARRALDDIDDTVAATHLDLARLLEALRADGEQAALAAGPASLEDLAAIIADGRRSGQPIELDIDDALLATLPASVLGSACRIVQESLTNARKHAAGAAVAVALRCDDDVLVLEIVNAVGGAAGGAGTGRGLDGMRERTHVLGGELHAGPTADGGFRVQARLPVLGDVLTVA